MQPKSFQKPLIFVLSLFIYCQCSQAESSKEGAEPPQEMYDACKNKNVGETCDYFDEHSHKQNGICTKDARVVLCYPEEPKKKE